MNLISVADLLVLNSRPLVKKQLGNASRSAVLVMGVHNLAANNKLKSLKFKLLLLGKPQKSANQ